MGYSSVIVLCPEYHKYRICVKKIESLFNGKDFNNFGIVALSNQ
jgi:hypothetical protein